MLAIGLPGCKYPAIICTKVSIHNLADLSDVDRNGRLTSRRADTHNGGQCSQEDDEYDCQEHGYDEAPPWQGGVALVDDHQSDHKGYHESSVVPAVRGVRVLECGIVRRLLLESPKAQGSP